MTDRQFRRHVATMMALAAAVMTAVCFLAFGVPQLATSHTTGAHNGYKHFHSCWPSGHYRTSSGAKWYLHHHDHSCTYSSPPGISGSGVRG